MNAQQIKQQRGFTIIEVILVLAIAALIFLMVFIALPALQAGQRDTARKGDVGNVAAAVTTYVSNNNGTFPPAGAFSYGQKVSSNTTATTVVTTASPVPVTDGTINVEKGFTCGGSTGTGATAKETLNAGTTNNFVVFTYVEAGGGTAFCQNN